MSFSAIRWALAQDSLDDPREALLLVVLADYYNEKTGQCNPSRDTLKKRARIGNNNTLTAKLSTLQKKGLITVYSQNGKSNCYRLHAHCETFHLAEKRAHYCLFAKRQEQLLSPKT